MIFKFKTLLSAEVQNWISENMNTDLNKLLLKKSPFQEVAIQEIVQQIKGKKVAEKKFPFLLKDGIVFPPNLNLEQSSSQITAQYKAENLSGKNFLDLTCGLGIDAFFLSENYETKTLVEQNKNLIETVENNWTALGKSARFINTDLETFLQSNSAHYDLIYLDPARRDQNKNKKFLLEDLSPNLLEIMPELSKISDLVMVKLSPLIDISYLLSVFPDLSEIQIIAVKNEVKELVLVYRPKIKPEKTKIKAINLESSDAEFVFFQQEEKTAIIEYSDVLNYLYLPNNAVLKSGAFNSIGEYFGLYKLHANTHLYTSNHLVEGFPGRVLAIEKISASKILKGEKFNIISKNHPLTPEEIKKKYKIGDGGEDYLIFTQSTFGKIILKSH